jgi:hypothetical protein
VLVVVVDLRHGLHAGIFRRAEILAGALLEPIENAADEGGDELDAALGAGSGLGEAEEKGEVAVDAFLLQHFGGFDAFPGGGDLDEHAVATDAGFFVEGHDLAGLGDSGGGVEGQAGVDLGGDAAGDDFKDL